MKFTRWLSILLTGAWALTCHGGGAGDLASESAEQKDARMGWWREARHAIFGPSNFLEIVGFMADHDRLHIQQAWNTLKALK